MIEAFFRKKSRIASIKFGPLGKFADGLAEKLVRNGYSTNMSQVILTRFGELSYYLHSRGVAPGMVNSSTIDDFLSERQSLITINGMENQLRHIVEISRGHEGLPSGLYSRPESSSAFATGRNP